MFDVLVDRAQRVKNPNSKILRFSAFSSKIRVLISQENIKF